MAGKRPSEYTDKIGDGSTVWIAGLDYGSHDIGFDVSGVFLTKSEALDSLNGSDNPRADKCVYEMLLGSSGGVVKIEHWV